MPIVIAAWLGWVGIIGLVLHKQHKTNNALPKSVVQEIKGEYCSETK